MMVPPGSPSRPQRGSPAPFPFRPPARAARACARASRAVIPACRRNAREKAEAEPNPVRSATSPRGSAVSVTSLRAASSRSPV